MYKLIVALCLTAAAAFQAPASVAQPRSTVVKAFESEIGAQVPLGFWDPLGLLADADQERFDRLRYVEIKHGRIAMLAVLGQITTKAGIFLPGTIDYAGTKFSDIPTGWAAVDKISSAGIAQIVAFVGFLELFVMKDSANGAAPGEFPGDFRNGALDFGWDSFTEEQKTQKRAIELNNGRAAQMGILALMVHEQLGVSLWPGGI
uniref:Plastid light harvesting protein n=1 Tax=Aureoumbra lagunensis TaxID=44058 RepID=A0A7S3NM50_9STRA